MRARPHIASRKYRIDCAAENVELTVLMSGQSGSPPDIPDAIENCLAVPRPIEFLPIVSMRMPRLMSGATISTTPPRERPVIAIRRLSVIGDPWLSRQSITAIRPTCLRRAVGVSPSRGFTMICGVTRSKTECRCFRDAFCGAVLNWVPMTRLLHDVVFRQPSTPKPYWQVPNCWGWPPLNIFSIQQFRAAPYRLGT